MTVFAEMEVLGRSVVSACPDGADMGAKTASIEGEVSGLGIDAKLRLLSCVEEHVEAEPSTSSTGDDNEADWEASAR